MDAYEIRRHPDGSLDVDFYRRRARRLRARARRDSLTKNVVPRVKAVVAAVILAAALVLMPAADGTGWNGVRTNHHAIAAQPLPATDSGKS